MSHVDDKEFEFAARRHASFRQAIGIAMSESEMQSHGVNRRCIQQEHSNFLPGYTTDDAA